MLFKMYSALINTNNSIFVRIPRFLVKLSMNIIIPLIFLIPNKKERKKENIIVSLTTFPARIEKTWIVIESIFRQTRPPKKVVLTLSKIQFSSENELPKKLLNLKNKGLEIIWTEDDLRSHKKYYYVMQKYPNDIIVTVDDDFIYEKRMLEFLCEFHVMYPRCIITNLAVDKKGCNYNDWENLFFEKRSPSYSIMQLGGSGVLYPSQSLHQDAFNLDLIVNNCPLADDIWLNSMAILNSTPIVKTDYPVYLMPLLFRENVALYEDNVQKNENNKQIKNIKNIYNSLFD